jgi:hypothetical protein
LASRLRQGRFGDAVALQQRVAGGTATDAETREYFRLLNAFRRKFRDGQLSVENAERLGITAAADVPLSRGTRHSLGA